MDVNTIVMENKKKKKGASSTTPSKVSTKVSLPQEGDVGKPIVDVDKHVATSNVVNKVIKVANGEDQSFEQYWHRTNSWNKDVIRRSGWRSDGGKEISNVGKQCGDDNQSTRIMGTTTKGAIPSTTREGGFAAIDKRRNPRTTTTKNCVT